jgi:hypothetical protein
MAGDPGNYGLEANAGNIADEEINVKAVKMGTISGLAENVEFGGRHQRRNLEFIM